MSMFLIWGKKDIIEKVSFLSSIESPVRAIFLIDNFVSLVKNHSILFKNGRSESNFLWEVLDSGKIEGVGTSIRELDIMRELSKGFSYMIKMGLKVENGFVSEECNELFQTQQKVWGMCERSDSENWYKSDSNNQFVFDFTEAKLLFKTGNHDFKDFEGFVEVVKTLDAKEVLDLVNGILKRSLHYERVDLMRSIFILVGNLDDVANSSNDQALTVSKDGINQVHSDLNLNQIYTGLSAYLPLELLARLGNNYIIFPNLNSQAFRQIIRRELFSIQSKFLRETEVPIEFDVSVENWLLEEGVLPSMGVRPLLSSIQYSIADLIPAIILGLNQFRNKGEKVVVAVDQGLDVLYLKGERAILKAWFPMVSKTKKLKDSSN